MGRGARGVRGIDLKNDDRVVDMAVIQPGMSLLTVCENGFGKRTEIDEYRLTRRGSKGVINIRVTQRNGCVIALRAVSEGDELMLITGSGVLLRTALDELRDIGRATQGVRLIRVKADDRVVAVAKLVSDDDENDADDPPNAAEPAAPADDSGQVEPPGDVAEPGEGA
jgi:DNA gyrase subunit A